MKDNIPELSQDTASALSYIDHAIYKHIKHSVLEIEHLSRQNMSRIEFNNEVHNILMRTYEAGAANYALIQSLNKTVNKE